MLCQGAILGCLNSQALSSERSDFKKTNIMNKLSLKYNYAFRMLRNSANHLSWVELPNTRRLVQRDGELRSMKALFTA